jgi:membrane protease YdiL (CAAX protease family)
MKKSYILFLGIITLVGFSALGFSILYFVSDIRPEQLFIHGCSPFEQTAAGLAYGLATGFIAWQLLKLGFMQRVKNFYGKMLQDLNFSWLDIVFLSLCAGIGEEILFRACMQYYAGIWITSIVFIAIHGYLNPKNWRLSIYGLSMTAVIVGLSYLFEELGMIFAISAHFAIDLFLFGKSEEERFS